jgi:hypothetical protein
MMVEISDPVVFAWSFRCANFSPPRRVRWATLRLQGDRTTDLA